ncbi:MAG: hypothetical protein EBY57_06935, partial [Actinobacteria bacterium]|nr:hypothetical protein [Actinomycetota bacterium]
MVGDDQVLQALQLVGPASIDRYLDEAIDLPGGGALNMAYHWRSAGHPVTLLSRVAKDHSSSFDRFVSTHGITVTDGWHAAGDPCSIDIRIADDRQPVMDGFVEGVLSGSRQVDVVACFTVLVEDRLHGGLCEGVVGIQSYVAQQAGQEVELALGRD